MCAGGVKDEYYLVMVIITKFEGTLTYNTYILIYISFNPSLIFIVPFARDIIVLFGGHDKRHNMMLHHKFIALQSID